MLDPEDRRLYSQCFAAPDGFVLDGAVGTTFSLDLESLLFAQFCIATSGVGEPESALADPVGLLEAIHRTSQRVTVFCHAGETNAPGQPHSLFALLEKSLIPARGRAGGAIFHPKLWVLRFINREDDSLWLRVIVLSRNLTTSRAWDSFLCLEGEPGRSKTEESSDLAALLRALPELALEELDEKRGLFVESLAKEVHKTHFAAPHPFEGVAFFQATGFGRQPGFAPQESGEQVLAVSPFVSNETLRHLRELAPQGRLISRPEEMAKCKSEVIDAWEAYSLDEGANSEADAADLGQETQTADAAPQGLHAKILAVQKKRRTVWWFGSGNLTDPVRAGSSVELMVQLEGKNSKVSIDQFLDAGFGSLLVPFEHKPAPPDLQEGNRSAVEALKQNLARSGMRLFCRQQAEAWQMELAEITATDKRVEVRCRPISLPGARAQLVTGSTLSFDGMTMEALTALICFELSAGTGETKFQCELTLKLPIEGLPDERDAHISRSIIKDRSAFLRYLHCLLGSVGDQLPESGSILEVGGTGNSGNGISGFASGLLEQLLRALHHEPDRLRGLKSLLERSAAPQEEAEQVVPEEFRQVWSVIEPHLPTHEKK